MINESSKDVVFIVGPCAIESLDTCETIAEKVLQLRVKHPNFHFVFKSSFDKANRTSIDSFRGPGMELGLEILAQIKRKYSIPVITDVHDTSQVRSVASVVDIIQIPAFLCRQTDLLIEAARTGLPVMVKKGQFLAPDNVIEIIKKLKDSGSNEIMICERGTTFGHHDLVVDFRGLVQMKGKGAKVIYDATHSVQRPGLKGKSSGGDREFIVPLAKAAAAIGVDGFFFEVHPNPDLALSDGPNSLRLQELEEVVTILQSHLELNS